ncbi:hypothetical protein FHG87_016364 [Trinorchestia longiramus]|nr:hypothetical protein FHG87_016364 [Trinorchestia longiramus]
MAENNRDCKATSILITRFLQRHQLSTLCSDHRKVAITTSNNMNFRSRVALSSGIRRGSVSTQLYSLVCELCSASLWDLTHVSTCTGSTCLLSCTTATISCSEEEPTACTSSTGIGMCFLGTLLEAETCPQTYGGAPLYTVLGRFPCTTVCLTPCTTRGEKVGVGGGGAVMMSKKVSTLKSGLSPTNGRNMNDSDYN